MKKILLLAVIVGLLIPMSSCRKGDDDPLLSLKSRKSRLAGTYTFASWESSVETYVDGMFPHRTNSDVKITDGAGTEQILLSIEDTDFTKTTTKNIQVYKGELRIEEDGTWEFVMYTTLTWVVDEEDIINDRYEYTQTQVISESGNWNFLDEGDDFEEKERVVFNRTIHTGTIRTDFTLFFVDGSSSYWPGELETITAGTKTAAIYEIDALKNKTMVLRRPKEEVHMLTEEDKYVAISFITGGSVEMALTEK